MKFKIYKLKFTSPLHIGRSSIDDYSKSEEFIHSDTLKSAIFSTALVLNPELNNPERGKKFFNSFLVSSTFPFYKDYLFLPKPKGKLPLTDIQNKEPSYDFKKKVKKVSFIDFDLFFNFFNNKNQELNFKDDFEIVSNFIVKKKFAEEIDLFLNSNQKNDKGVINFTIVKSSLQERVYIRKTDETYEKSEKKYIYSDPYIVDRINFIKDSGLYFFLETKDEFDINIFEKILNHLGDFGIGTDRNVGNGQFIIDEILDKEIIFDSKADYLMSLSLFLPSEKDVQNFTEKCQYKLIKRGGWISNHIDLNLLKRSQIKKSIYMIDEASVFENNCTLEGTIVDLSPDDNTLNHPVWRDGRPIFLPINNINV
ncbi:MAG: type III-A CRISPR-associated RAMP protein Csm4 [Tenuifilum sp.]|uniref:type III-A CRISPR-associated RAMP protein Csm4 n=1 Tax=Tenuifilum sp. TaxID=2760880 RepID=UPI002CF9480F|nr:type III-A CRISPR-associated RAMP protein Csm4 [Paludibacteraceae bacterium]HPD25080.1 type III-A CRISPR-associated RAMP protein Csm4 [Bacteroidales bacterium]